jgi:PhnB protein
VASCDQAIERAVKAGATLQRPVQDHFYGDRAGTIVDPFGHVWTLATHIEDVPPDEIARRAAEMHGG